MSEERNVRQSVTVDATLERAFEALTQTGELRDWFSDLAWADVHPGGRYALHWGQGYHVEGRFLELEPPQRAVISWQGTGEPAETRVVFGLEPREGGVEVTVLHTGFGPGSEWDAAVAQSERGWQVGLENLRSTLETGTDLRTARQPFLGINLDILTPERAAREGIAAQWGIYIQGTVAGSGAQAAGLCQGDVLVALGGRQTPSFDELGVVLRAHQAGDVVEAELVRGQQRETVQITLGPRPRPELPASFEELGTRLAERHQEVNGELRAALHEVSEQQADQRPGEGQWSVKQILAHLSEGERAFHMIVVNLAVNGWLDGGPLLPDQIPGRLDAVLDVTPTLEGLVNRFLEDEAETAALVRRLPAETMAYKVRFRRIAEQVITGPDHTLEHVEQIKQALQAVRGQ